MSANSTIFYILLYSNISSWASSTTRTSTWDGLIVFLNNNLRGVHGGASDRSKILNLKVIPNLFFYFFQKSELGQNKEKKIDETNGLTIWNKISHTSQKRNRLIYGGLRQFDLIEEMNWTTTKDVTYHKKENKKEKAKLTRKFCD